MSRSSFVKTVVSRRWFPYSVAALAFCLFVAVVASLWFEKQERFPILPPGSYIGTISGIFREEPKPVRFYVEALPQSDEVFFVLIKEAWMPQRVSLGSRGQAHNAAEWVFPLVARGPDRTLKLSGTKTESGYFSGAVSEIPGGGRGAWWLTPIRDQSSSVSEEEASSIRLWLTYKAELEDLEASIAEAQKRGPELKAEVDKLTDFITEGETLRQRADSKFTQVRGDLQQAREGLKKKREEARRLESRVELSQRVTAMGKLVSLARESLDREGRWLDSMLAAAPDEPQEKASGESETAKLRKAIALEQERLDRIVSPREYLEDTQR